MKFLVPEAEAESVAGYNVEYAQDSGRGAIKLQSDPSHGYEELSDREPGESILLFNLALSVIQDSRNGNLTSNTGSRIHSHASRPWLSSSENIRAPGFAVSRTPLGDQSFSTFDKNQRSK
ncbi:hypothetical protein F2Q70_00030038 [Brassica cretica]|uniref:Uncharacterized protein n=2 Tax=Brassica cretica TaxID=69181 RepID=A0A8S9FIC5_BRACR|nr:hypothetical protein F2Q70_00030038 [Brassica cretica]KAF2552823.1 hypothetical protein F2Q68_00034519 [Brassica cretica]KAF3490222.1 hypothetical protein F2Q69_00053307 [Brassica cretica]KAF3594550.1 hypothetical protein DY000_02022346 [Brassica cretica]